MNKNAIQPFPLFSIRYLRKCPVCPNFLVPHLMQVYPIQSRLADNALQSVFVYRQSFFVLSMGYGNINVHQLEEKKVVRLVGKKLTDKMKKMTLANISHNLRQQLSDNKRKDV